MMTVCPVSAIKPGVAFMEISIMESLANITQNVDIQVKVSVMMENVPKSIVSIELGKPFTMLNFDKILAMMKNDYFLIFDC